LTVRRSYPNCEIGYVIIKNMNTETFLDQTSLRLRAKREWELLSKSFTELSLAELKQVKGILEGRLKDNINLSETIGNLTQPRVDSDGDTEYILPDEAKSKVIDELCAGLTKLEKMTENYPSDLIIINGLIRKKQQENQAKAKAR